jgi:hypothetical protein
MAQGLSVRGSTIRRRFEMFASAPPLSQANIERNELPLPQPGQRLVELERARREQCDQGTRNR